MNEVKNGEIKRVSSLRNSNDEELTQKNDVEVKWREYFVQIMNGDEISEVRENVKRERTGGNEGVVGKMVREVMFSQFSPRHGSGLFRNCN